MDVCDGFNGCIFNCHLVSPACLSLSRPLSLSLPPLPPPRLSMLAASDSLATLSESQSATDSASMMGHTHTAAMRPGLHESSSAYKLRRDARRKEKERGGAGAYEPLSLGQRVLWALAGSAVTALAVIVHFQLIVPLTEKFFITTA
jgi:hypothetical protein